ncbi:phosphoribosylamine--glycine ligase [Candidatus Methylacidiphilum fumarolicum]|uniref:Phosphoribosylamine--glycine ligase n=2 Tax=Candidatus Methylacidiphilum fumarolicum TaxID=591154 RepID=I0JXP8_METFB|nr:phosphoribosylamine--glycine ligase [Candidatus Methylacidiphilum fumarolicum]MBW6415388.1 phosphoribosylamine--glycine ligase [Candidatus Methylacidiphilum fumarolicum]TFE69159.1 phosphoribosylamine--glycine ligase [Candidatus Methylacidiphilum fumarolicum]TFE72789.1 phosphoribosylamine--glycine ligase [Candidatus Methylacidiphilum fumarolicum]TFE74674.1 phosphoribosylamine--glycine ligase [Candidatus Methylacidiphilum fumarolicum]TFE77730.1 phosphoribosylamine--glycine ligase [Candidatus 
MKVLIVGGGGREHALCWSFKKDPTVKKIFVAPGNAGTEEFCTNLPIGIYDMDNLFHWARENRPDLTVVGPEVPLCDGIADKFESIGLKIVGPKKRAARLEGSKAWTKELMVHYKIPTAEARIFENPIDAIHFSKSFHFPQVIKADGLASGKGVLIVHDPTQAENSIRKLMDQKIFGAACKKILIEEFLEGIELSLFVLLDGRNYRILAAIHDYKKAFDFDKGLNTGGMGAFFPSPIFDASLQSSIEKKIILPLLEAFQKEQIIYKGILYAGLMITRFGPAVLEFNIRLGDPEAQVLMPALQTSFMEIAQALTETKLEALKIQFNENLHYVGVVVAAQGYPEHFEIGKEITLNEKDLTEEERKQSLLFHSGTKKIDGRLVSSSGRVLCSVGWAQSLEEAKKMAYRRIDTIHFEGMFYRKDIGQLHVPSFFLKQV